MFPLKIFETGMKNVLEIEPINITLYKYYIIQLFLNEIMVKYYEDKKYNAGNVDVTGRFNNRCCQCDR